MLICKECNEEFKSLDSLRRHRIQKHKINAEQTYIDYVLDGVPPTCLCGCGEKTKFLGIIAGFRDYKVGHSSKIHNNWGHNKEALKKSRETQKKMYENGELVIWNKGLTIDDERVRDNIYKVMSNPNRGKNISEKLSGVPKSEEHKVKIKEKAIERWSKEEEREKQSNKRMNYIINNGFTVTSKLEEIFNNILKNDLNLIENKDYHRQHYVREIKGIFDFKISNKKILIEVDGDFWHCNPNTKHKEAIYEAQKSNLIQDEIKNKWCETNNYKLLRFWETDINDNRDKVIEQLKIELNLI